MKVAVYAICLNEEQFVDRFMDACSEADYVVIADTGSTDGTVAAFRRRGALVHEIRISPWRFDTARNAALSLVPPDADICFALDLDEVPCTGWRNTLEKAWRPGATRANYLLVYSHLPDGSPGVQFYNARIHTRHGYSWRHICHEALYPDGIDDDFVLAADLRVDHYPDPSKSRAFYLPLLERAVKAEPHDARMAHYLAREYYYNARYDDAITEFQRYLDMNGHFTGERVGSMIFIGKCLAALGRDPLPWYLKAVAEMPDSREAWVSLAETYYSANDWPNCFAAAKKSLSIARSHDGYTKDPHSYGPAPHDLAALGAWYIGLHAEAIEHARTALSLKPDDVRLKDNLALMEKQFASQDKPTGSRRKKAA